MRKSCVCVQVTVLERTREVGKKILISGGARWYSSSPANLFCCTIDALRVSAALPAHQHISGPQ